MTEPLDEACPLDKRRDPSLCGAAAHAWGEPTCSAEVNGCFVARRACPCGTQRFDTIRPDGTRLRVRYEYPRALLR
jgi:hypothetical protein